MGNVVVGGGGRVILGSVSAPKQAIARSGVCAVASVALAQQGSRAGAVWGGAPYGGDPRTRLRAPYSDLAPSPRDLPTPRFSLIPPTLLFSLDRPPLDFS